MDHIVAPWKEAIGSIALFEPKWTKSNQVKVLIQLTVLVSVATAVTTNMRKKLMKNSKAKAWAYPPEGTVTPPPIMGWKIPLTAKEAPIDPKTWAATYTGTCYTDPGYSHCKQIFDVILIYDKIINNAQVLWAKHASKESVWELQMQWWPMD